MNKFFLVLVSVLISTVTMSQVGIGTETPTEDLDINGTTRSRELPENGAVNAIYTKPDGSKSTSKDQTFEGKKTVVVDQNGVLGTIDGLPLTVAPKVKTIEYVRKSVPIDVDTPIASVATLGNLSVRYNTTTTGNGNWIEFSVASSNHVTAVAKVDENGGLNYGDWEITAAEAGVWYKATTQTITGSNRDTYNLEVSLHNADEFYRGTVVSNAAIAATGTIAAVSPRVTIFLEKLK